MDKFSATYQAHKATDQHCQHHFRVYSAIDNDGIAHAMLIAESVDGTEISADMTPATLRQLAAMLSYHAERLEALRVQAQLGGVAA